MELADHALSLGFQGRQPEGRRKLAEAFELERDAADLLRAADIPSLSRAVYHRSLVCRHQFRGGDHPRNSIPPN